MASKKITFLGILLSLSIILSYVETLFPIMIAVPGVKLGLANIITLVILYKYDFKNAFIFMILRVLMAGFLFSGMAGIIYGIAGGTISVVVMNIAKKKESFSTLGVSVIGGMAHNIAQIVLAIVLMESTSILYYFPVLICSGAIAGLAIGYLSYAVYKVVKKVS